MYEGLISRDPEVMGGAPVFPSTRVPVHLLFEYLADGLSLDYFLETFPTVERAQAVAVLRKTQESLEQALAA